MDAILAELETQDNDEGMALRAYESVRKKLGIRSRREAFGRVLSHFQRIAAVLAIPLAAGLIIALSGKETDEKWVELDVPAGQKQELTLSDGTKLQLNSGSRITYPVRFRGKTRELFLDGEVMADVAHDEDNPFIIHAGSLDLQVLGTKFDIKAYSRSKMVDVHLFEGSVKLTSDFGPSQRTLVVAPGQHAQFDKEKKLYELENFDTAVYQPFTATATLVFQKIEMHDIAVELQRIFGREIVITDSRLAQKRVLAYFSNGESLEEILSTLNFDDSMNIDTTGEIIYISSK